MINRLKGLLGSVPLYVGLQKALGADRLRYRCLDELGLRDGDTVTLVAGDGDFVPTLTSLKRRGFPVTVMFWSHASRQLRELADEFVDLDPHFGFLTW